MLRSQLSRFARAPISLLALCLAVPAVASAQDSPSQAPSSASDNSETRSGSRIVSVSIDGKQAVGTFGGVAYQRVWGTVAGVLSARDTIEGYDQLAHDADGNYPYQSEFEIIAPEKPGTNTAILIEVENRGNPNYLNTVHGTAEAGPPSGPAHASDVGSGFLFAHGTSYARVQWQTGIVSSVPQNAEGVGEVIVRDFGRMLAGRTKLDAQPTVDFGKYDTLILGGISLSGFFIDTFLAEGFNADPVLGTAVYQGAIAVDGTGNWIAINELAAQADVKQFPYVVPDAKPLRVSDILQGHVSDPFYIDIANYTDFYRLRASITDVEPKNPRVRRYDWPTAHAPAPIDQSGTSARASRCNGGTVVDMNPVPHDAYLRAVTIELERELGVPAARQAPKLPPSALFELTPAPSSTPNFNALAGARLSVPIVDENDQPIGGVHFPDAEVPVGRPIPASVPPVVTTSIDATCGNLGGWQQFSPEELTKRYGSEANYLKLYAQSLDRIIAKGYALQEDRAEMLKIAAALYERRPTHPGLPAPPAR